MPTDLCGVLARKREAQREYRLNTSVMLGSLIVTLANVVLLFADHALAPALAQIRPAQEGSDAAAGNKAAGGN